MTIQPLGVAHVNLNVTDLERSIRFYTELLGCRIAFQYEGALTWLAAQVALVGSVQSGFALMDRWGYEVVAPWRALGDSWSWIARGGDPIRLAVPQVEALNLVALVGFSILGVIALRRLPLSYGLYMGPSLLLLLTRELTYSPLMSVSRYTLVVFPCLMVLALLLARRPWLAGGWLAVSAGLQIWLMSYYALWGFIA